MGNKINNTSNLVYDSLKIDKYGKLETVSVDVESKTTPSEFTCNSCNKKYETIPTIIYGPNATTLSRNICIWCVTEHFDRLFNVNRNIKLERELYETNNSRK